MSIVYDDFIKTLESRIAQAEAENDPGIVSSPWHKVPLLLARSSLNILKNADTPEGQCFSHVCFHMGLLADIASETFNKHAKWEPVSKEPRPESPDWEPLLARIKADDQKYWAGDCQNDDEVHIKTIRLARAIVGAMEGPECWLGYYYMYNVVLDYLRLRIDELYNPENGR